MSSPDLPLVSIVTPSLNQGQFITATIESVLSQDYPRIEYLVIDGGSTDETLSVLRRYGDRVRWGSEPDRGQADAVNKGFRMARGEILGWLNSDDTYRPGAVSRAVAYLESQPAIDLVYGQGRYVLEDGKVLRPYPTEPFSMHRLAETCIICQPAAFFRRRVLSTVGFLDERLHYCMDYDFWVRIGKQCQVGYIEQSLADTRFHRNAKTVSKRLAANREALETVKRHFGAVSPAWLCDYARALLEPRLSRGTRWRNVVFVAAVTMIAAWQCIRVNGRIPGDAIRQWASWLRKKDVGSILGSDVN